MATRIDEGNAGRPTPAAHPQKRAPHKKPKAFFRDLWREIKHDELGDVAAMLTYYAIFALFPMAVFVLTIALMVVPNDTINQGVGMLTDTMPAQVRDILTGYVQVLQSKAGGGFAIGGILIALWGASRGAVALGKALNKVYEKEETRPWWKVQLSAILVTLGTGALLLIAMAVLAIGPVVGHFLADRFGLGGAFDAVWTIGRWLLVGLLVIFIWAVLYKFLPNTTAPLRVFSPGAVTGVLIWVGASLLFSLYVGNFGSYDKTYGALGAVIIFLTWMWISNLALLAGAEINDALEADDKEPVPTPERPKDTAGPGPTRQRPEPRPA